MKKDTAEMIRETVEIEYPAEFQRGRSRQPGGASSPNLFHPGRPGIKGQVKILDISKGERATERGGFLDALAPKIVELAVGVAAAKATPYVERWWDDNAFPAITSAIRSMSSKITKTRKADNRADVAELAPLVKAASPDFPKEVDAATNGDKSSMSSAEAQKRLRAMLVAAAIAEKLERELSGARIEDDNSSPALKSPVGKFTPQEVEDHISFMLEASNSWIDEFVDILEGGRIAYDQHALATSADIEEAPRLADGEN